jgi:hypothetical protein
MRNFIFKNMHYTRCIKQAIRIKVQWDYIPLTRPGTSHDYSPNRADRSIKTWIYTIDQHPEQYNPPKLRPSWSNYGTHSAVPLKPNTPSYQEDERVQGFPAALRRKPASANPPVETNTSFAAGARTCHPNLLSTPWTKLPCCAHIATEDARVTFFWASLSSYISWYFSAVSQRW